MKKYAKKFGTYRKSSYLCTQEQWTCSIYWDWGVPDRKSCQVRGDSFFLCLLGWIDFEPQKLSILHKYIGGQYVVG